MKPDHSLTEVRIKQEMIEEAVNEHAAFQEVESLSSSDNESDSEMSEADSETTRLFNSTDESDESDSSDGLMDTENVFVKRKSEMTDESQKQKRQHVIKAQETKKKNPSPTSTTEGSRLVPQPDGNDNHQAFCEEGTDETESMIQGINDDIGARQTVSDEMNKKENSEYYKKIRQSTTDSDAEWERIASTSKRIHNNGKASVVNVNSHGQLGGTKKVQFKDPVRVVTEYTDWQATDLKHRGFQMVDQAEKISTPIKIEFNVDKICSEFNLIQEVSNLFDNMAQQDSGIKIREEVKGTILWELGCPLPENEQFIDLFKMRDQSYRNGNKKVTIFCVVEAKYTMNRMKYSEPVKSYIFQKNIWVKPDFYSTEVVSCPGFFTLVHPKMTNKRKFEEDMQEILRGTEINKLDEIVKVWENNRTRESDDNRVEIPKFHVETNVRKWGGIHTEVLSMHCSTNDANYLKYLLSEASSQGRLEKGVFVPTGIHLMEGKEVMYQLLKEHKEFVESVTSFQLSGLTVEEMNKVNGQSDSIKQFLMRADGVWAIEQTYQTNHNGQWMVVVDKIKVHSFQEFITEHIRLIYKTKSGKQPKLITYQIDQHTYGYRLLLVDSTFGKVSTYAEALKKRFPQLHNTGTQDPNGTKRTPRERNPKQVEVQLSRDTPGSWTHTSKESMNEHSVKVSDKHTSLSTRAAKGSDRKSADTGTVLSSQTQEDVIKNTNSRVRNERIYQDGKQPDINTTLQKKLEQFDKEWQQKLQEFDAMNAKITKKLNKTIEDRVDKMLDIKIKQISNTVSTNVTTRIVSAMKKLFPAQAFQSEDEISDMNNFSPETLCQTKDTSRNEEPQSHMEGISNPISQPTSPEMDTDLINIQSHTVNPTDSPHDEQTEESSRLVT